VRAPTAGRKGIAIAPSPINIDDATNSIGFLKEWQRLNVAITRAKYSLWVVGHEATLATDDLWAKMIEFIVNHGLVV
jgi:senataxin